MLSPLKDEMLGVEREEMRAMLHWKKFILRRKKYGIKEGEERSTGFPCDKAFRLSFGIRIRIRIMSIIDI